MSRKSYLRLAGIGVLGLFLGFMTAILPKNNDLLAAPGEAIAPLDRVPADAALFVHFEAGDLWNHEVVSAVRKKYPEETKGLLSEMIKEMGIDPENLNSLTFFFPKMPAGPGDETLFILQVTTKKPYDQKTILKEVREKNKKPDGEFIELGGGSKLKLNFTTPSQFTLLHETLIEDFKKGATKITKGVQEETLKSARSGKYQTSFGIDPSQLPNEIFTATPPEVQPFLPLLKTKGIFVSGKLDANLTLDARFVAEAEDKAVDAERSFNLLMKVAENGIDSLVKDPKALAKGDEYILPLLKELQKSLQQVSAKRDGNAVTASFSIKADSKLYVEPFANYFLKRKSLAGNSRSQNNLKQIALALHNYESAYGVFPPSAICDKRGKPLLSWRVAILPYIEQNALYQQFKLDEPWDSEHNLKLSKVLIKVYEMPNKDSKPGLTHYRVFTGNDAFFDPIQGTKISQVADGTSNTLMVFEGSEGTPWTKPDEVEFDPKKLVKPLFLFTNGLCNVAFADGSVRTISEKVDEKIWRLLIQKNDGNPIPNFDE
jgi:prepilin-type processing-associated H-X9-DG protein